MPSPDADPRSPSGTTIPAVVFVHGFGSSEDCWAPLLTLLGDDTDIDRRFGFETFTYPTAKLRLHPLRRIPRLDEISNQLAAFIDSPRFHGRQLTLVGHSQGGLVIERYLADLLEAGRAEALTPVRQVIFFATPTRGSTILSPVRKLTSLIFPNPQERSLRVLNPEIAHLQEVITARVVSAVEAGTTSWPIPIQCFWGLRDRIVTEASARTFGNAVALDGDHFSILQPESHDDTRYAEFKELLLEPVGHAHVFEIDRFEAELSVGPHDPEEALPAHHGSVDRSVRTDNVGRLIRRVTFARGNRCADPYRMRYATQSGGYVKPTASHHNEAAPMAVERYEAHGLECEFELTPEPGETYTYNVDVFGGFGAGHRDQHFHLLRTSYYEAMSFQVDLTKYVEAGWTITRPPTLYFHPEDTGDHDICAMRVLDRPQDPVEADPAGRWRWELGHVREGIVDMTWDVAPPSTA
ncbi:MAG TPA: alpha/beta fold hydrolase [Actinomycetota bacterium]